MKWFFSALFFVLVTCALGEEKKGADNLVSDIKAILPKGWSVVLERDNDRLVVKSEELVLITTGGIMNDDPSRQPELSPYMVIYHIGDWVSQEEYAKRVRENEELSKRMRGLYDDLRKRGLDQKFDSFTPKTEEDHVLVDRYESMWKLRQSLPDYYYGNVSLWSPGPFFSIVTGPEAGECYKVERLVHELLTPYQTEPQQEEAEVQRAEVSAETQKSIEEHSRKLFISCLLRIRMECGLPDEVTKMNSHTITRDDRLAYLKKHEDLLLSLGKEEVYFQLDLIASVPCFAVLPGSESKAAEKLVEVANIKRSRYAHEALRIFEKYYTEYDEEARIELEQRMEAAVKAKYINEEVWQKFQRGLQK